MQRSSLILIVKSLFSERNMRHRSLPVVVFDSAAAFCRWHLQGKFIVQLLTVVGLCGALSGSHERPV
ncbi:MAG: hypothetical protein Q7J80_15915 [Anaerolineales bacterium]|nr:hypothetical protein [Anaerolineales bacterium]